MISKPSIKVTFVPSWEMNGGQLLQVLHQSNGAGSRSAIGVFKIGRKKDRRSERKIWQQNLIFSPVLLKRCLA